MDKVHVQNAGADIALESRVSAAPTPGAPRARLHRQAWCLSAVSAVLQVLIFPLFSWTFLAWAAVAPLMVAVLRARRSEQGWLPATVRQGFALGYLAGVVWSFGSCYWVFHVMHNYGGLNAPVAAVILVLFCLTLGLFMGVFAALIAALAGPGRLGPKAVLFTPLLWVAVELFRGYAVDFPWNPLGTVLVDNIPLSRVATVTGVYGLSFEILLINVVFAIAFLAPRRQGRLILVSALLAAALLQAGTFLSPPRLPADRTARLVQSDVPILYADDWTAEYFQNTLTALSDLSMPNRGELMPGEPLPDLIVWPESPAPFFLTDQRFRQAVSDVARETNASVIVGSLGQPNPNDPYGKMYNSAALVATDGQFKARYDKVHLVPFGEYVPFQRLLGFASKLTREVGDFVPGTARKPVSTDGSPVGVFICYEAVFPNEVRQFAANGARLFVNISNDGWFGNTAAPVQHLNMARIRAIENNRWLLRDTNTGITGAIDPYGRLVMRARSGVRTAIDVPYTLVAGTTFYTRHGDWFAYSCAIISIALLAIPRVRARVRQHAAD